MSAKIVIGGVEITIPTSELGEALHQLGQWLPQPAAASRAVAENTPPPSQMTAATQKRAAATQEQAPRSAAKSPDSERAVALSLLKLIADHHVSGGVTGGDIMPLLGTDKPKGIGSKVTAVNRAIVAAGFSELSDVYTNTERIDPKGPRQWRAGPRIRDAILELEKRTLT